MKVLHEVHRVNHSTCNGQRDFGYTGACQCSYCVGDNKMAFGLNIPGDRGRTSWWVIKYGPGRYIRFTFPLFTSVNDALFQLFYRKLCPRPDGWFNCSLKGWPYNFTGKVARLFWLNSNQRYR